jgi:hypothetical protein
MSNEMSNATHPASANRLRWLDWLHYALARLSWPGALGLALLLAAGLLQTLHIAPLRDASLDLQQRAERLARIGPPPVLDVTPKVIELSATLPAAEQMPQAIADLFNAARHAGLSLRQGSYRAVGDKTGVKSKPGSSPPPAAASMLRYQISLPVQGDYPAVRGFVTEALEQQPSLALDGMRLQRDLIGNAQIDAELRFTLYLGAATPGAPR